MVTVTIEPIPYCDSYIIVNITGYMVTVSIYYCIFKVFQYQNQKYHLNPISLLLSVNLQLFVIYLKNNLMTVLLHLSSKVLSLLFIIGQLAVVSKL